MGATFCNSFFKNNSEEFPQTGEDFLPSRKVIRSNQGYDPRSLSSLPRMESFKEKQKSPKMNIH